jgi:hypothetical protein
MNKFDEQGKANIKKIVSAMGAKLEDDREMRALLISWLKASPHINVKEIINELEGVKVFFVWTEGIPTGDAAREKATTCSYGLARFVCWCLGVNWSDINLARNSEAL